MRLIRYRDEAGQIHHGVDEGDGTARRLPGPPTDSVAPAGPVDRVAGLLAPIEPANVFCIGLNYGAHAKETGAELPEHPVIFMKPTTAVIGPGETIRLPACCERGPETDYEVELAVVIGKAGRDIARERALEHVLGYTVANDVSARRWQKQGGGGQWIRGKSFDTFCPLGPAIVTADEVGDPQALELSTTLNGRGMQSSTTGDMIFSVAELIAFISRDTTLLPGTVILTGTPEGVGFSRSPAVFLSDGDEVTVAVAGVGELTNPVAAAVAVAG
ncbi:MAG: fumarylacetoacetate hydrolase family protein [Phycisphaeraceae bacterium]